MSEVQKKTVRTTLAVTLVIFASKAAGFVRDIISAGYFATGMERDAYSSAYTLFYVPVLLFNSCITSTLIPLYVEARDQKGLRTANNFASNCINIFAAFSLAVGLIMIAASEPLVRLVFGGYASVAGKLELTGELLRVMLPSLTFVVTSIAMSSVLNANENYLAAQLTGFPLSFAVIVATVGFSRTHGILAVAWGVFAAGILQMLILLPSMNGGMSYSLRFRLSDERFRRLMRLALPAILSMAVNELNHIVDKSIASYLNPGDTSAMDYAYRLITFATGVLAVPITTIMFSRLSRQASQRNRKGVVDILCQSVEVLSMILLPVTAIGGVLARDIIRLAYEHGKFGADATLVTTGAFFFYLLGIWGFGLRDVFNRAFHALQDTKTPMLVACVSVAMNIVLNNILSRFMGVNGLALATTISCAAGALILTILIRRKLGRVDAGQTFVQLGKILLATVAGCACAALLNGALPNVSGKLALALRLIGVTALSAGAYLAVLLALRVRQVNFVKDILRRKRA